MVFKQLSSKRLLLLGLVTFALTSPACILAPEDGDEPPVSNLLTERNTVENTITRHGEIWANKRFPEYEQILHDGFEFFILDEDSEDLAWVQGGFWSRSKELEIAGNMFNVNYSGDELPVDSIEFGYTILNQDPIFDSNQNVTGVSVTADAEVTVLVGPDEGWFSDTRFLFEVVEDTDEPNLWQIQRQQEIRVL